MSIQKTSVFLFCSFFITASFAEEVDSFIKKEDLPQEASTHLNQLINRTLDQFELRYNKSKRACSPSTLEQEAFSFFGGNLSRIGYPLRYKSLEILDATPIEMVGEPKQSKNMYRGVEGVGHCCVKVLNVQNVPIGVDKIGHFFEGGSQLWARWIELGKPEDKTEILKYNNHQEHSLWGLDWNGVKSYGDLNANWAGFHFYKSLFQKEQPYFRCKKGLIERTKRQFKLSKYFNLAWSEAYNCSAFPSAKQAKQVANNLKEQGLACPMYKDACRELDKLYADQKHLKKWLISPVCRKNVSFGRSIEPARPPELGDYYNSLKGVRVKYLFLKRLKGEGFLD